MAWNGFLYICYWWYKISVQRGNSRGKVMVKCRKGGIVNLSAFSKPFNNEINVCWDIGHLDGAHCTRRRYGGTYICAVCTPPSGSLCKCWNLGPHDSRHFDSPRISLCLLPHLNCLTSWPHHCSPLFASLAERCLHSGGLWEQPVAGGKLRTWTISYGPLGPRT